MTSISVPISRIYDKKFQSLYLKKERLFLDFLLSYWNMHEILNILQRKEEFLSIIITEIIASERDVYLSV